jgi:hypothetical protein
MNIREMAQRISSGGSGDSSARILQLRQQFQVTESRSTAVHSSVLCRHVLSSISDTLHYLPSSISSVLPLYCCYYCYYHQKGARGSVVG